MSVTVEKAAAPTLTYAQYLAEGEINRRYEILDGVRLWMPNPTVRQQDVLFNVATALKSFGRVSGLGRMVVAACDVLITYQPLRVRQPDVLFISQARVGDRDPLDPSALNPAPELVVEVLSPNDTWKDTWRALDDKILDYCAVDVRKCWIVRTTSRTVEVLRLTRDGEQPVAIYAEGQAVPSVAFPGLSVPVADVFAL